MKKYAIIVAGGSGTRMGTETPKQFLNLHGKPVIWYTLNTFLSAYADLRIVLVVAASQLQTGENILQSSNDAARISLATGGPTRFHSVKNGLEYIHEPSIVFVHDAVRCLLSVDLIHRCYETTLKLGNAIPAVEAIDSIRINIGDNYQAIDRKNVRMIQTPQTFASDLIKKSYRQDYDDVFTDDASVVERLGVKINLVEGESANIKITQPLDMIIAEKMLEQHLPC